MTKRIVTKFGDIFFVELDGQFKRFFQYIAIDKTQLSNKVIRIFKRKYPMDYHPDINEILKDEIEFYAHTFLRDGIANNAWYRVGKSSDIGSLDHILFRTDGDLDKVTVSENGGFGISIKRSFLLGSYPRNMWMWIIGLCFLMNLSMIG